MEEHHRAEHHLLYIYSVSFPCFFPSPHSFSSPFLTGPSLQTSPDFHKEINCFQVRKKQTRSLEKIKNNEFLSAGLRAHLSHPSPLSSHSRKRRKQIFAHPFGARPPDLPAMQVVAPIKIHLLPIAQNLPLAPSPDPPLHANGHRPGIFSCLLSPTDLKSD